MPTATLTPTPTPVPSAAVRLYWPQSVSPLEPVEVEVDVMMPPGVEEEPAVSAVLVDPHDEVYWSVELEPRTLPRHVAPAPVHLPLVPAEGEWRLVVDVRTTVPVEGALERSFTPESVAFRDLEGGLPPGTGLLVPEEFVEATVEGDAWSGSRVWRYRGGELGLWWAPGPTEDLLLNTAIVMLEASHEPTGSPDVMAATETTWDGMEAFRFQEAWPGARPSDAWVIRGPDDWLYVLRVRNVAGEEAPPLLYEVAHTFTVAGE
jgi:hypothetical protein